MRGWSHFAKIALAWALVFALCGIGALYFLAQYRWYADRPMHGGGAPSVPALSLALDYLFGAWLILPILLLIAFVLTAIAGWSAFLESGNASVGRARRVGYAFSGIVASLCALAIVVRAAPTVLADGARSVLCDTTTFARSVSPNGRYEASAIQIDCGAMSDFNRQVIFTRIPFFWASQSILFFNGEPKLSLSWQGRMLTIRGSRSAESLPHPPPDPVVWGGMMARYVGPASTTPR